MYDALLRFLQKNYVYTQRNETALMTKVVHSHNILNEFDKSFTSVLSFNHVLFYPVQMHVDYPTIKPFFKPDTWFGLDSVPDTKYF